MPAPLAGMGYKLAWADEFDALDIGETGRRWAPNLWYERPAGADQYSVAESVLTLKCLRRGGAWDGCQPRDRMGRHARRDRSSAAAISRRG